MSNKYDRPTHEKIEIPEEKATPAQNLAFDYLLMIVNIGISVYNFVFSFLDDLYGFLDVK